MCVLIWACPTLQSSRLWTGMGEFNSNDHYIYYCGQESLRRNRVAIMVNKRVRNAVLGCNLKNDRMISVRFQGKPLIITVTSSAWHRASGESGKPSISEVQTHLYSLYSWSLTSVSLSSSSSSPPLHWSFSLIYPLLDTLSISLPLHPLSLALSP